MKKYIKNTKIYDFQDLIDENRNKALMRIYWCYNIVIISLTIFSVCLLSKLTDLTTELNYYKNIQKENNFKDNIVCKICDTQIDGFSFVNLLKEMNIQNQKVVVAQAILESNFFKSDLFLKNNNLFGMRKAYQRPTTNYNLENGNHYKNYSYYISWKHCVYDYALWQSSYARNLNEEEYLDYLGRCYAQDKNYVMKLKSIIKNCETPEDVILKYNL